MLSLFFIGGSRTWLGVTFPSDRHQHVQGRAQLRTHCKAKDAERCSAWPARFLARSLPVPKSRRRGTQRQVLSGILEQRKEEVCLFACFTPRSPPASHELLVTALLGLFKAAPPGGRTVGRPPLPVPAWGRTTRGRTARPCCCVPRQPCRCRRK